MAATTLAASRGTPVEPVAFRPVLRGALMTDSQVTYLRGDANGSTAATEPLWQPAGKVAGRHLAPYLAALPDRYPAAVRRTPTAGRA